MHVINLECSWYPMERHQKAPETQFNSPTPLEALLKCNQTPLKPLRSLLKRFWSPETPYKPLETSWIPRNNIETPRKSWLSYWNANKTCRNVLERILKFAGTTLWNVPEASCHPLFSWTWCPDLIYAQNYLFPALFNYALFNFLIQEKKIQHLKPQ